MPELPRIMQRFVLIILWLLQSASLDWTASYSVNGIRLGCNRQQVLQRLGTPQEKIDQDDKEVWKYRDSLEVTFRRADVSRLYGTVLEQNDKPLVQVGELSGVVRRRLGEPANNEALGIQPHPEVEVMMYQGETTTIGVFSRAGRVSLVGLTRRN